MMESSSTKTTATRISLDQYKGIETKKCPCVTVEEALLFCRSRGGVAVDSTIIVDTRTPKEFEEAHVIDALSVPLMNNEQRHIIGKTYKQESKEAAISKGFEMLTPTVRDLMLKFVDHKEKRIFVYCWRGGMRSRIVVNLLLLHGFDACQVSGGFKRYMNDIVWKGLDNFASSYQPKFIVLFGHTGTRKTEILEKLDAEGYPVIDLEGLAGHKGSLYGHVNSTQKSQKMFSIGLYHKLELFKDKKYIFVEGEAKTIGKCHQPEFIYHKINNDECRVLVDASVETRVKVVRKEYVITKDTIQELFEATNSDVMVRNAGKKNVAMLHAMLENEQYDAFAEWLLVNYYDKRYRFAKQGFAYSLKVESDDIDECCNTLTRFYHDLVTAGASTRKTVFTYVAPYMLRITIFVCAGVICSFHFFRGPKRPFALTSKK